MKIKTHIKLLQILLLTTPFVGASAMEEPQVKKIKPEKGCRDKCTKAFTAEFGACLKRSREEKLSESEGDKCYHDAETKFDQCISDCPTVEVTREEYNKM